MPQNYVMLCYVILWTLYHQHILISYESCSLLEGLRLGCVDSTLWLLINIQYNTKQNFISLKSHNVNTRVYMYNATYNNWWQCLMGEGEKPAR